MLTGMYLLRLGAAFSLRGTTGLTVPVYERIFDVAGLVLAAALLFFLGRPKRSPGYPSDQLTVLAPR